MIIILIKVSVIWKVYKLSLIFIVSDDLYEPSMLEDSPAVSQWLYCSDVLRRHADPAGDKPVQQTHSHCSPDKHILRIYSDH